jgi:hypothetical protein
VELVGPSQRVLDEEPADLVGARTVEVHRRPPRRPVARRGVRTELIEDVPLGSDVVVDHVEHDGEPAPVTLVHEERQAARSAVGILHRVGKDTVVAPVPATRELPDGHQLHGCHAERRQVVEVGNDRLEGAVGRVGADVQLVDHVLGERR